MSTKLHDGLRIDGIGPVELMRRLQALRVAAIARGERKLAKLFARRVWAEHDAALLAGNEPSIKTSEPPLITAHAVIRGIVSSGAVLAAHRSN